MVLKGVTGQNYSADDLKGLGLYKGFQKYFGVTKEFLKIYENF